MSDFTMSEPCRLFFDFLRLQIGEESIVEDDLDIARLAVLVPDLCNALKQVSPLSESSAQLLAHALSVVDEITKGTIANPEMY